jgi:hypothetical protein
VSAPRFSSTLVRPLCLFALEFSNDAIYLTFVCLMSSFIRFAYTCGPFSRGLLQHDVQPCSKLGEYRQRIKLFGSDGEAKATCNPTIARSLGYYRPSKHVHGNTFDVLHGSLASPPPPSALLAASPSIPSHSPILQIALKMLYEARAISSSSHVVATRVFQPIESSSVG